MGCDIHLHVETKTPNGWREVESLCDFYNSRNYSLFYLLAGVRGPEDFEPISEPRGLPNDLSATVRLSVEGWECDAHSRTWFTLAELQAVDWSPTQSRFELDLDRVAAHPHTTPESRIVIFFDN